MNSQAACSKENLFPTICRLAREKNQSALKQLLVEHGVCINFFQSKYAGCPVTLLAKEGDKDSVEFLMTQFKASLNAAVCGYAMGGHTIAVNELLQQGASLEHAVCGYAIGKHTHEVNELLHQGASCNEALLGYAMGGHVDEVNALVEPDSRYLAVLGYALGGHITQVNALIDKASLDDAVLGYAISGHTLEVNKLTARGASLDNAAAGYAMGGHTAEVNELIKQGASREAAIYGYAKSGDRSEVNKLITQGVSIDEAVRGYAQGGHILEVNELIAQGANPDYAAAGYEIGGQVTTGNILRLMSYTDDKKLRKLLAAKAKEKDDTIDVKDLKSKTEKTKTVMANYKLDYELARALNTDKTIRPWLLQGSQLVRTQAMQKDIFLEISSRLLGGLSIYSTNILFHAVHERSCELFTRGILFNYFNFFPPAIENRCRERKMFSKPNNPANPGLWMNRSR